MIKQWWTAQELAELSLPTMPMTVRGVNKKAATENWTSRPKSKGKGSEYHASNLPDLARMALTEIMAKQPTNTLTVATSENDVSTMDKRRDARLIILQFLDDHRNTTSSNQTEAFRSFSQLYSERLVENIPQWIYNAVPSLSPRTLRRWIKDRQQSNFAKLGQGQNNKKGRGILETANNGDVAKTIAAYIIKQPHLTAGHIRDFIRSEYGYTLNHAGKEKPLPNNRTFTRFIAKWKKDNADLLKRETDPDNYKNSTMLALGKADEGVTELNQVWEIDASPADLICSDGRYNLYAIVDVWSRRAIVSVTETASTEGSLALLRRAIIEWGKPAVLKTDNGADFVSHRFLTAVSSVGIKQDICPPFTPEGKAYVERFFGTLQRDLMPLLPGFIGHSVADRKAIEARKAFGQRLGDKDATKFNVSITHDELQNLINDWCETKYGNKENSGIKTTPNMKAASYHGSVLRIENPRALDLLLAPLAGGSDGIRTITKKGLRINNNYYFGHGLEGYVGKQVLVRCDPDNMGVVYCFEPETQTFICNAVNLEMEGVNRKEIAAAAKTIQKQIAKEKAAELKSEKRKITPEKLAVTLLEQAREDHSNIGHFPSKSEKYTNDAIDEATRALTRKPIVSEITDEQQQRLEAIQEEMSHNQEVKEILCDEDKWWARWMRLDMKLKNGAEISVHDHEWYEMSKQSSWWQSKKGLEDLRDRKSRK